jgi:hypothetical protein
MLRSIVLSAALAVGLATAADAAIFLLPVGGDKVGIVIVRVSEGCGTGWWRGPTGHCHPFNSAGGWPRGSHVACPPGMHVGAGGHECWQN